MSEHNNEEKFNMEDRLKELFGEEPKEVEKEPEGPEDLSKTFNRFVTITESAGITKMAKVGIDRERSLITELKDKLASFDANDLMQLSRASAEIMKTAKKIKSIHTVKALGASVSINAMFGKGSKTPEEVFERFLNSEAGNGLEMMKEILDGFGG